jgi:hypothetical protein
MQVASRTSPFPITRPHIAFISAVVARALEHSFGAKPGTFTMTGAGGKVHRYESFEEGRTGSLRQRLLLLRARQRATRLAHTQDE